MKEELKPSYVISISGGKDSTDLLCTMVEDDENIIGAVFFDTGWEFPQMYEHLDQLDEWLMIHRGFKITRLQPREPFDYMFSRLPIHSRKTGEIRQHGRGWAHPKRRWCTGRKTEALRAYANALTFTRGVSLPLFQCVGFAADETHRAKGEKGKWETKHVKVIFPLIQKGISESAALSRCYNRGFTWSGLYEIFDRLSCFCCPLGGLEYSRKLRKHFPDLWKRMLEMESWLPEGSKSRRYYMEETVSDLDARFSAEAAYEARLIKLPGMGMEGVA